MESTEIKLIEYFFIDQADYIHFYVRSSYSARATDVGDCFAELKKIRSGVWIYMLSYKGKMIGEYVKPFRASKENVDKFNRCCRIIARWMRIYVEVNDINLVPEEELAFGDLTYIPQPEDDLQNDLRRFDLVLNSPRN